MSLSAAEDLEVVLRDFAFFEYKSGPKQDCVGYWAARAQGRKSETKISRLGSGVFGKDKPNGVVLARVLLNGL